MNDQREDQAPILALHGIEKRFASAGGSIDVLRGVSLALGVGDSLALTGESGSGKSTLLHIAAGLELCDKGRVEIAGRDIAALDDRARAQSRRRDIGLVFQQFNLIPSLSVAQNLSFQARLAGRHDAQRADRLAERLGIDALRNRYPEQISGGQQQRVAIARALAGQPRLLLADEPTGNLDEATGDSVMELMLDLCRETGAALLLVTHSQRLAARCARRLHLRAGRLEPAP